MHFATLRQTMGCAVGRPVAWLWVLAVDAVGHSLPAEYGVLAPLPCAVGCTGCGILGCAVADGVYLSNLPGPRGLISMRVSRHTCPLFFSELVGVTGMLMK